MKKLTFIYLTLGLFFSLKSLAGTYVSVQADKPSLKYQEGQIAGFTITENSGYEGTTEVEVYFQTESTPLTVTDLTTHKFAQTPALTYGPAQVIFKVYEKDTLLFVKRNTHGALLETINVNFNVRYNDTTPPILAVLPDEDTTFLDDMPFMQVNYSDSPAGVDTSTFEAVIIDELGTRQDVTSLFTVTANFATVQFDETHKLPNGLFFLETSISDFNENKATKTVRFAVEIPVPTAGFYTGLVLDNQGQPVADATIDIASGGTVFKKSMTSVMTDAQGKYRLPVDQGGNVLLSATKAGWTTQTKWVSGESGKDTPVQTFTIKPLDTNVSFISKITGGTGSNVDGSVQFVIAPNSASQDIHLNITQAKGGSELPGPLPTLTEFTFMGTMGPSGTTFSPPGLLKIKNEHGFPAGTEIVVGMFNETTGLWEDSGSSGFVSNDGKFVEYQLPHFSSWDANQPVVPPTDKQPMAVSKTPDVAGTGVQCPGCRIDPDKGNLGTDYELPYVMRYGKKYQPVFTYWSQSARPLLYANAEQSFAWMAVRDLPDLIQVEANVGKIYKKLYYKGGANIPGSDITYSYSMMMEAKDTAGQYMPTGVYDFNINIGNDYKNSRFATALYFGAPPLTPLSTIAPEPVSLKFNVVSRSVVLNSRNSPFGKGWTMQGLEKLSFSTDDRIVWEDGSGKAAFFTGLPVSPNPAIKYKSLSKKGLHFSAMKNVQALSNMNVTSVIEKDGSFLVADCEGNQVLAVATDGATSVLAGTGTSGFSGDGGLATQAELACPSSIYPSYDGGLLIADKDNHRIRKINKKGIIQTIAGDGSSAESNSLITAKSASIGTPTFVTEDKLHSVFFITGNRIRYIDPRGRLLTMVASVHEDTSAFYKADLQGPSEIKFDEKDNLIISDTGNNRIVQIFLQSGEVRVIAGNFIQKAKGSKGTENTTKSVNLVNVSQLKNPVSYVYDKRLQISYILAQNGEIFILTRDGRVQKTNLTTVFNKLVLSRNVGILGAVTKVKSGIKPYVSPAGNFSTLEGLPDGTYRRIEVNGDVSYFNDKGLLTSKNTLDGKGETFVYDTRSRLTTWTIPGGESYTFSYDNFTGRLQSVTDPAGRITEFDINSTGQLVGIKNPKGISRHYGYSPEDLLTSETDEDNNLHQYVYSANGLLSKEIYPDGGIREIKPRIGTQLISDIPVGEGTIDNPASAPFFNKTYGQDTSTGGRSWRFITDQFGNVTESIDSLGRSSRMVRDFNGLVLNSTSPSNLVTTMTYNAKGLPLTISKANRTTVFEYANYGRVSAVVDPLSRRLEMTYNAQGNMTEFKDHRSKSTTMTYNPVHHLLESITDPLLGETHMTYNSQGLLSVQENDLGHQTQYSYNDAGLLTDVTDPLSHVTHYEYDDLNRLVKIKDHENNETVLTYSETGKLLSLTDAKNHTYSYTYNSRGWLMSYTNPLSQTEYYDYDGDGLLIAKKRFDGSVTTYTYDAAKQLAKIGARDHEIRYNYDLDGRIKWVGTPLTNVNRSYDMAGRMAGENQNGFFTLQYDYSADDTLYSVHNNDMNIQYYYSLNQVISQIRATIGGQVFSFNRDLDDLNRPVKDTLPSGMEVERTFNSISQLTTLVNKNNQNQILSSFGYTFDNAGRQTQKTEDNAILTKSGFAIKSLQSGFAYDNINRLVAVSSPAEAFSYDAVGNRQYTGGSINAANQLLSDGYKYTFTYSLNGELTSKTNTLTGDKTEYFWNGLSQLMSIRIKNSSNVVKKELYYVYDGLGRRIKRQLIDYENPSLSNERRFYYDRDQIVEERNENNQVVTRYMNGTGVDDPLLLINASGVYGYTKDGLGSVKELVKLDQQIPHQRYSYSSYGMTTEALEVVTPDKKPIENRYAYTGRELEHETGLYYYRARYYDPELGRFISEDPIGFSGGDVNLFRYVVNDPMNQVDPSGLDRRKCSRRLNSLFTPIKVGRLRHDYVQFRDTKGDLTTKSWGNKGMIDESEIDTSTRSCGNWESSSDKADKMAEDLADTLGDIMDYGGAMGYNCQDYSENVFNFQRGK